MIPHNKPYITKKSIDFVAKTINSGWVNYGEVSKKLENKISKLICNRENRVTLTSNGTSALFISLKALGLEENSEVIIPSYTCTALLNAINLIGAKPIICDIGRENLSFTKKGLKNYISDRTKAIIVVHTFGIPCEIDEIKEFGIPIIEDCSQSLGSKFNDDSLVGSKGDFSIFSFYASKMITGGMGGAILSKRKRNHDFVKDYINFDIPENYKERFNFQLSDINSSIILAGINELDTLLLSKKNISNSYQKICSSPYNSILGVNNYRFILDFKNENMLNKAKNHFLSKGIKVLVPIENFELLHNYLFLEKQKFPNSEWASKSLLSFPIYHALTHEEVEYITRTINDYISTSTCL